MEFSAKHKMREKNKKEKSKAKTLNEGILSNTSNFGKKIQ